MQRNLNSHKAFLILLAVGVLLAAKACFALEPTTAMVPPALSSDLRETTSLMTAIFKVMGSLAVVVGLMLALLFVLRKTGLSKGLPQSGTLINVLESRMVAPKKYIAIVKIANKSIAVGITDSNITMLTDIDSSFEKETVVSSNHQKKSSSFQGLLKKAAGTMKSTSSYRASKQKLTEANDG